MIVLYVIAVVYTGLLLAGATFIAAVVLRAIRGDHRDQD